MALWSGDLPSLLMAIFYKRDNLFFFITFCSLLLAIKENLLSTGADLFLLEQTPLQKDGKNNFDVVASWKNQLSITLHAG